jgi:hypothetical protein
MMEEQEVKKGQENEKGEAAAATGNRRKTRKRKRSCFVRCAI